MITINACITGTKKLLLKGVDLELDSCHRDDLNEALGKRSDRPVTEKALDRDKPREILVHLDMSGRHFLVMPRLGYSRRTNLLTSPVTDFHL